MLAFGDFSFEGEIESSVIDKIDENLKGIKISKHQTVLQQC